MSCKCQSCEHNRKIDEYHAKQPERKVKKLTRIIKKNPPTKKHLLDRYESARKSLLQDIKWFQSAYNRGRIREWNRPSQWTIKKYNESRAALKKVGLLDNTNKPSR